jgi:hypothetical protein
MNYIALQDYKQGWIFRHKDMPVPDETLLHIKPLADDSAQQFWRQQLSKEATHASHFLGDDWPAKNGTWLEKGEWQSLWEADDNHLPELIQQHCQWDDNTVVYFCYDLHNIIQTTWKIFKQHWKNFLFYDDSVFLLAKKRHQAVRFESDGYFEIGNKPK